MSCVPHCFTRLLTLKKCERVEDREQRCPLRVVENLDLSVAHEIGERRRRSPPTILKPCKLSTVALSEYNHGLHTIIFLPFFECTPEYKRCKNGVDGIQSESCDVCCPAACGVCGGDTCASPADDSLGADECCESNIKEAEVLCIHTGEAPCIVNIGK